MSVLQAYLEGSARSPHGQTPMDIYRDQQIVSGDEALQNAFAAVESSGRYDAIGPETGKGRAYGKYQVMDFNIGPWTQKILGQSLTPDQFLASPEAQDAVFNTKMREYMGRYGSIEDAASMWFSGRPYAEAGNASDGYLTVPEYVSKVRKNYNPMEAYLR